MSEPKIHHLAQDKALAEIMDVLQTNTSTNAPFVLVLGAGFSAGLVPTTRELVTTDIPIWMHARRARRSYPELLMAPPSEHARIAKEFWTGFVRDNPHEEVKLALDPNTGIPAIPANAYTAAFSSTSSRALGTPGLAREFQREVMQLQDPRLNLSHFLLASILGIQPGGLKHGSPFCRLILTTNFDPFLQLALQAVNKLYFMSDAPDLGFGPEIHDPSADAIHLVYVHGSIHRRSQAASDDEIRRIKQEHAAALKPILERRGVLVLGYGGWDDAIVEALHQCQRFDNGLYWLGRDPNPSRPGAYGSKVKEILGKQSTHYVQITSADDFMSRLWRALAEKDPPLIDNPIGQVRSLLKSITLRGNPSLEPQSDIDGVGRQGMHQEEPITVMKNQMEGALRRLAEAESRFRTAARIETLLSAAKMRVALSQHEEAINACDEALGVEGASVSEISQLCNCRALANALLGRLQEAAMGWSRVIDALPGAPVEQVARALVNRGLVHGQQGAPEDALSDCTRVIDALPGAPVVALARALINRGFVHGQQGEPQKALSDYARVIDALPGAPVEEVARALVNRGHIHEQQGEPERALADYDRLIEQLYDASAELRSQALLNRGTLLLNANRLADALSDYTRLINDFPRVQMTLRAWAYNNRGYVYYRLNDRKSALADYSRVIDEMTDARIEPRLKSLFNRSRIYEDQGTPESISQAIADCSRVIDHAINAPREDSADALLRRGILYNRIGLPDKALADFTRVIELPVVSAEKVARAWGGRAWAHYRSGRQDDFLTETRRASELGPQIDFVAYQLGLALLANGYDSEAVVHYRDAVVAFPIHAPFARKDVEEAVGKWLTPERAKPVLEILKGDAP